MVTKITEKEPSSAPRLDPGLYDTGTLARGICGGLYVRAYGPFDPDGHRNVAWVLISDTLEGNHPVSPKTFYGYLVTLESATVVRK